MTPAEQHHKPPKPTALDRVIGYASPARAFRRMQFRTAIQFYAQQHYDAAQSSRRTLGWKRPSGDANAASAPLTLSRLRDSARHLVRNNGHAVSAIQAIIDDTVGVGILPMVRHELIDTWTKSTDIDVDGRCDLAGLEHAVMRTVVESGECIVRRRHRRPSDGFAFPLQIQVLEPDYIDSSKHFVKDGSTTVRGIEFDSSGKRTAYWLYKEHPGATFTGARFGSSVRVPAENVLHIYRNERAGQVRGSSWFAPVLIRFNDFDELADATLMKQKIAACLSVITTDVDGSAQPLGEEKSDDSEIDLIGPGLISNVAAGRSIEVVNPPSVRDYSEYAKTTLREIAVGIGVTPEDMTGDYCIAPETLVLRSDLRWVRADTLEAGDGIVAFDENRPEGRGRRRKWRRASVLRAGRRDLPRTTVVTDKATVAVSNEHRFLCISRRGDTVGKGSHVWVRADELRPNDKIAFLASPWKEGMTHVHGYLKGISDGEGNASRGGARIGISQTPGPVLDEIGDALMELGFPCRLSAANGKRTTAQWEIHGTAECLRFLGEVRPTRLLKRAQNMYDGIAMSGGYKKKAAQTCAVVISVQPCGVGPVVTLSTSTETVITNGLCSHNTRLPFSAARMSRLRHWARVEGWRWRMMAPQFLAPLWVWAAQTLVLLTGETLPPTSWTAPALPMIEPDKEGLAINRNIRTGITTWSEELRRRGYNPEEFWAEYKADREKLAELGITLDSDASLMTQAGQLHSDPAAATGNERMAEIGDLLMRLPADQAESVLRSFADGNGASA